MQKIVIDPITRIEGHLRVEVVVDENNIVKEAYSGSTLWRGIETIVKNRDPRDVGFMTQRICGVCTYSHYRAGIEAVENALKITPPLNAKLVRTLINAALYLHDHCVHFYQLHGLDFIDIVSALRADVQKASKLAYKYTQNPIKCSEEELNAVKQRVEEFAKKGSLGPFANAYWGHKTYRFTKEQNLIALSHYLECLRIQRTVAELMAIFGSKNPHPQTLTVGGITCVIDILDQKRLDEYEDKFKQVQNFIHNAYMSDIKMLIEAYKDEPSVINDIGVNNFMCANEFLINENEYLFEGGIILDGDLSKVHNINENEITEEATRAWYKDDEPLHPYDGKTEPNYTGLKEEKTINNKGEIINTKVFDTSGKYSWIKAPRYNNKPMQVGPIATILINYAKGNKIVVDEVDNFIKETDFSINSMFSTLGRTAARMIEAKIVADNALKALNNLKENIKNDEKTCSSYSIDTSKSYKGRFIGNAPRGMLSHWVCIENGVVKNYQCVVPSTWNASSKDHIGQMGSYEACLIGLKINDLTKPLEVVRKIHSYDPCIACAVHVLDSKGIELGRYKINTNITK